MVTCVKWIPHFAYYNLTSYERRAANVDRDVQHSLDWGGSPAAILASLRASARDTRDNGVVLGRERGLARSELTQMISTCTRAEGAFESFMAQYGKMLVGGRGVGCIGWYGVMKEDWQIPAYLDRLDEYVDYQMAYVRRRFTVDEPEWLDQAGKLDAEKIARAFDDKASEIEDIVDAQRFFRARLTTAVARMSPISKQYTQDDLIAARQESAASAAVTQLRRPEWLRLAAVADQFPPEARQSVGSVPGTPWEQKTARERLLHLLVWLNSHMNEQMKNYIQARRYRGFAEVPAGKFEEIEGLWQKLDPALTAWDAYVGSRADKMRGAAEQVGQYASPVHAAYATVPAAGKREIAGQYRDFSLNARWLTSYLENFARGTQPFANLNVDDFIREVVTAYPEDLKRRRDAQEAARLLREKMEREAEARRRAEEEARRLAEEERQKLIKEVQALYATFASQYERRSAAGVVALLSDDWSAGDGTTLADLEETLSNSFGVFDEVTCTINGLQVTPQEDGSVKASYQIAITGRIHRNRIKHEEDSQVTEVLRPEGGQLRIFQTVNGRFWYQQ